MKDLRWMSNIGVLKDQEHEKFSDKQRLRGNCSQTRILFTLSSCNSIPTALGEPVSIFLQDVQTEHVLKQTDCPQLFEILLTVVDNTDLQQVNNFVYQILKHTGALKQFQIILSTMVCCCYGSQPTILLLLPN